jgi:hypothetical protein
MRVSVAFGSYSVKAGIWTRSGPESGRRTENASKILVLAKRLVEPHLPSLFPKETLKMFNTLSYARKLEAAGVERQQAEAHIQIIAEVVEGSLTTKQDLKELEYRLVIKLGAWVAGVGIASIGALATILKLMLNK